MKSHRCANSFIQFNSIHFISRVILYTSISPATIHRSSHNAFRWLFPLWCLCEGSQQNVLLTNFMPLPRSSLNSLSFFSLMFDPFKTFAFESVLEFVYTLQVLFLCVVVGKICLNKITIMLMDPWWIFSDDEYSISLSTCVCICKEESSLLWWFKTLWTLNIQGNYSGRQGNTKIQFSKTKKPMKIFYFSS